MKDDVLGVAAIADPPLSRFALMFAGHCRNAEVVHDETALEGADVPKLSGAQRRHVRGERCGSRSSCDLGSFGVEASSTGLRLLGAAPTRKPVMCLSVRGRPGIDPERRSE
jgi:hypothetical protein